MSRLNKTLLFVGMSILFLGLLVVTYDYPQIQFFENLNDMEYEQLSDELKEKHPRLELEFGIGVGLTIIGMVTIGYGFLKTRLNKVR